MGRFPSTQYFRHTPRNFQVSPPVLAETETHEVVRLGSVTCRDRRIRGIGKEAVG